MAAMSKNPAPPPIESDPAQTPQDFWERRYGDRPQVWSGRVNPVLAELAIGFTPGRALDLGCGEGGDSLWLAERGWEVTAVDISETAIARGRAAAAAAGIAGDRIHWVVADLAGWIPDADYELVSACFLQSPLELDRSRILNNAAARIVPGGHLLVVSHAAPPPWASQLAAHHNHNTFLTPEEEVAALGVTAADWQPVIVETRQRAATAPDGQPAILDDAIVLLRHS